MSATRVAKAVNTHNSKPSLAISKTLEDLFKGGRKNTGKNYGTAERVDVVSERLCGS